MTELSQDLQAALERIEKTQAEYAPDMTYLTPLLGEKAMINFIAPAAGGKNYIMNALCAADSEFKKVSGFTNREKEPRDTDDAYVWKAYDEESLWQLVEDIDSRKLVQYAVHPTTGRVYGSYPEDYSAPFNMLDTLSGKLESFKALPFRSQYSIALVTNPEQWIFRFESRFNDSKKSQSDRKARIEEARLSLKTILSMPDGEIQFIENTNDIDETTDAIFAIVKEDKKDATRRHTATLMLQALESLS